MHNLSLLPIVFLSPLKDDGYVDGHIYIYSSHVSFAFSLYFYQFKYIQYMCDIIYVQLIHDKLSSCNVKDMQQIMNLTSSEAAPDSDLLLITAHSQTLINSFRGVPWNLPGTEFPRDTEENSRSSGLVLCYSE